jgi:hypothetical protein
MIFIFKRLLKCRQSNRHPYILLFLGLALNYTTLVLVAVVAAAAAVVEQPHLQHLHKIAAKQLQNKSISKSKS